MCHAHLNGTINYNCTGNIPRQGVFALARETVSDIFSTFCIRIIIPLLAVSLLYLLIKSENQLLLIGLPLLAVVFFIKKQLIKAKATQHYKTLI